jgi:hypothetical protein
LVSGAAPAPAATSHGAAAQPGIGAERPRPDQPKIQLALLLDTSSSMDGLIDQARNQLWEAVNEFAKARKDGVSPTLEVAVYEYGNSGLPSQEGYIRQVTGLTRELDRVSEALFSLTTNGGAEYCGQVIHSAVAGLSWSTSEQDIKAIFIAGNEPFTQGPVSFKTAIGAAKQKGVTVNTIHAGPYNEGARSGWQEGALLAGGHYMSIDHNHQVSHIVAPQDQKLAELNARLNQTYVPYGPQGAQGAQRQLEQDAKSNEVSLGLLAQRAKSKASALYNNANWDLVDALNSGALKLENLDKEQLPPAINALNREDQQAYIETKAQERKAIQEEIVALTQARDAFVADERRKAAKSDVSTLNDAMSRVIRAQGEQKKFAFQ